MIPSALTAADRRALSRAGMGDIAVQNIYFIQREGEGTLLQTDAAERKSELKEEVKGNVRQQ
jgi:hypothetical protein